MIGQRHVMKPSFASGGTALVLLLLNVGLAPTTVYGQEKETLTESQKQAEAAAKLGLFSLPESREKSLAEAAARRLAEKEDRPDKPKLIRSAKPGEPIELTFDNIKFDMEKGTPFQRDMLTEEIENLHGKTIRLRGFIKPGARQKGLKKFVFVRDDKECCFGPGAAIFDCVLVQMEKENPTDFTVRPVTIEGKFYLKEYKGPDGNLWAIYRMKDGLRK
jgi:hypothetical protein